MVLMAAMCGGCDWTPLLAPTLILTAVRKAGPPPFKYKHTALRSQAHVNISALSCSREGISSQMICIFQKIVGLNSVGREKERERKRSERTRMAEWSLRLSVGYLLAPFCREKPGSLS